MLISGHPCIRILVLSNVFFKAYILSCMVVTDFCLNSFPLLFFFSISLCGVAANKENEVDPLVTVKNTVFFESYTNNKL